MRHHALAVLVVDDHPAVRAGVAAIIDGEDDLRTVGTVGEADAVLSAVDRERPDVVVLDRRLPGADGLVLCRALRRARRPPPAVLVFSALTGPELLVPAHLAGASAVLDKTSAPETLTAAIRRAAAGECLLAPAGPELLEAAGGRLRRADLPLLGMLVNGVPVEEIAEVLDVPVAVADRRVDRLLPLLLDRRDAG